MRSTFTNITPLPPHMTRQAVVDFLHDHLEMIDLNPLIIDRHTIAPPPHALAEERSCVWYSLTDRISYLPGGVMSGQVTYTCAFHDLPDGLQTHCYAPMGLELRDRWSLGGSLPGEPKEPVELGIGAPASGLYLREDVDMQCNFLMASFVKKTLKKSHGSLVQRMAEKARTRKAKSMSLANGKQQWTTGSSGSGSLVSPRISLPAAPREESAATTPSLLLTPSLRGSGASTPTPAAVPSTGLPLSSSAQHLHAGQTLGPYGSQQPLSSSSSGHLGEQDAGLHFPGSNHPQHARTASQELKYSGTIYRGTSRPHDYNEYSARNPYEDEKSQAVEIDSGRQRVELA